MTTISRRAALGVLAGTLAAPASTAAAEQSALFIAPGAIVLADLLAPPPGADSEATRRELQAFHAFEKTRSAEQERHAIADSDMSVFRFLAGMGIVIDYSKARRTAPFFVDVARSMAAVVEPAKVTWARPRPSVTDSSITPLVHYSEAQLEHSGSYPSGHAVAGMLYAILLARLLPDLKPRLFERAKDFGHSRFVAGLHYPSDIEAGQSAAAVIGHVLLHEPRVLAELHQVEPELRGLLHAL